MSTEFITIPANAGTSAPPPTAEPGIHTPADKNTPSNLERLLNQRPPMEDLVDKNILRGGATGVDPSLAAKRVELEKSLLEDKLNTALQNRPLPNELVKDGILTEEEAPQPDESLDATQSKGELLTPSH